MEVNLVSEGLKFMVLGMGTVFVFLIIMIVAMNIQAKIVDKFFPDGPSDADNLAPVRRSSVSTSKKNKIAAIMGAIMSHKQAK